MFSEINIATNERMDLAHCTALLIDLTLGEHLQILGERRRGMGKRDIFDTKPAISLKRSGLEPKLPQSIYSNVYSLSIGDKSGDLA